MNRKALGLSGLLLLSLIALSVIADRDVIQGVVSDADLAYSVAQDRFGLGETVVASGTVAFAGYALALVQNSIWYRRNWSATLKSVADGLLYALLTAGVFGWLWPS